MIYSFLNCNWRYSKILIIHTNIKYLLFKTYGIFQHFYIVQIYHFNSQKNLKSSNLLMNYFTYLSEFLIFNWFSLGLGILIEKQWFFYRKDFFTNILKQRIPMIIFSSFLLIIRHLSLCIHYIDINLR